MTSNQRWCNYMQWCRISWQTHSLFLHPNPIFEDSSVFITSFRHPKQELMIQIKKFLHDENISLHSEMYENLKTNQLFGWCNINTSGQLLLVKNNTVPLGRAVLNYEIKQWGILLPRLLFRASASDWALRSFRVWSAWLTENERWWEPREGSGESRTAQQTGKVRKIAPLPSSRSETF